MNVIRHNHMMFNPYGVTFLQKQKLHFTNAADSRKNCISFVDS